MTQFFLSLFISSSLQTIFTKLPFLQSYLIISWVLFHNWCGKLKLLNHFWFIQSPLRNVSIHRRIKLKTAQLFAKNVTKLIQTLLLRRLNSFYHEIQKFVILFIRFFEWWHRFRRLQFTVILSNWRFESFSLSFKQIIYTKISLKSERRFLNDSFSHLL